MTDSASRGADKRTRTVRRIVACAQRLCLERGFSGFTLEDLASEVGVSRRTLFNYVPDKEHAVLGLDLSDLDDDPDLTCFRSGGPTGELLADLTWLLEHLVDAKPEMATDLDNVGAILSAHPQLLTRFLNHMAEAVRTVNAAILARPGETAERATVASGTVLALLHAATRASLEQGTPLPAEFRAARAAFDSIVRGARSVPAPDDHPTPTHS